MAEQLKSGDVVRLKSGGPVMTVLRTYEDASGEHGVATAWFDGKRQEQGNFPPDSLTLVVMPR